MKLSKKSWHYKLWTATYGDNIPTNLCPYFWSLLLAIVLFPFFIVWNGPFMIGDKILCHIKKTRYSSIDIFFSEMFLFSLLVNLCLLLVVCMIVMWWHLDGKNPVLGFGTVGWILLFAFIFFSVKDKYFPKKQYVYKEKKPNILLEIIKAKKNKYCPKIDWL